AAINQRILERWHFLIEPDFVFIHTGAANIAALIDGFFDFANFTVWLTNPTSLQTVPTNERQHWTTAINKYRRLGDLFGGEILLVPIGLFSLLRGLLVGSR